MSTLAKLADYAPNLDVALLGPQVAYTLDKSAAICEENHIPIGGHSNGGLWHARW